MDRRPAAPAALAVAYLTLVFLAVACGSSSATASPTTSSAPSPPPSASGIPTPSPAESGGASPDAAAYRAINGQVQAIRGLDERQPVAPKFVSSTEMADVLRAELNEQSPPELVAAYDRLYRGMGLLSADASLERLYLDLLESQVAGLYVPSSKSLYVVSKGGGVGPVERVFYAHEYDHALQDQHFDLEAFQEGLTDQTDRQLARQALVEGDAYVVMGQWLQQNLKPDELLALLAATNDPEALAALEKIPPIVQASVLFPATQGLAWVLTLQAGGGWTAVDDAWAHPPESTEQILHQDKWASREPPVPVDLPNDLAKRMGNGWSVGLEDTFGEYELGVWLGDSSGPAAAGWGGDRVALLDGPGGAWGIAWRTGWDTAADASEFRAAADAAVARAGHPGDVLPGAGGKEVWVVLASDATALARLASVLGLAG